MFPKRRILDPKPRRVEGPKSATGRSHEGGANVAAAICHFPALNFSFVNLIPRILTVNFGPKGSMGDDSLLGRIFGQG